MGADRAIPPQTPAGREAAELLRRRAVGPVLAGRLDRWLYSTDASSYRLIPEVVLVAGHAEDLAVAADVAAGTGVPLLARGAATSVTGQAIGSGIVVDCFKLDRVVELDPGERSARVQPGVIQASLNRVAAASGLEFGPDTSTVEQATIGGMVGNNSSGSRSIVYGQTGDKLLGVKAVTAGGSQLVLGRCRGADVLSGLEGPAAADIARGLEAIRSRAGEVIRECYPTTRRFTSGYDLRCLLGPRPAPVRLMAASEGTLALFSEIEVRLDPRPSCRLGAALAFGDVRGALVANTEILDTGPSAVELLDLVPLRAAPNLDRYRRMAPLLDSDAEALLTVEYQGTADEVRAGVDRLRRLAGHLGAVEVKYLLDRDSMAEAAALRRAVLPLMMGAPGVERPTAFVEDTVVDPARLAEYFEEFRRIVASHGVRGSFSGHASAGCLHVRPLLDLKSAAGVGTLEKLARDVAGLVSDYRGALSGEHGCGLARSWLLAETLDERLYAEYRALKEVFDPRRLLAPGRILDGPPVDRDLRFGPGYRTDGTWRPRLSYAQEGGFDLAVERCFGAGLCKKLTGTMCPPAAVGRDELRTTRARANALQAIVAGAVDLAEISAPELEEVLGTCLACKACKTECPAGVDMAALKSEWLAERRDREGVPALIRSVGHLRSGLRAASSVAPLVDRLARTGLRRPLMRALGVSDRRPAPRVVARSLVRRAERAGLASDRPEVSLFGDCFIMYQEPDIGEAFLRLARAADAEADVVDAGCCGRTMMSTGLIDDARAAADRALDKLDRLVRAGRRLVFVEPSCLSMVRDDWQRLLPDDPRVARVAGASASALSWVADRAVAGELRFEPGGTALYHPHCHERALSTSGETERALKAVPELELEVLDAGCCGMSGVFGYEADHYELSVAIAERGVLPAVRAAGEQTVVLASGTSCRTQIDDLSGRSALHPLIFLASRLGDGRRP
jgi:FAD/FMN-containing dehydrogenase/Fe-S oxidoreductase